MFVTLIAGLSRQRRWRRRWRRCDLGMGVFENLALVCCLVKGLTTTVPVAHARSDSSKTLLGACEHSRTREPRRMDNRGDGQRNESPLVIWPDDRRRLALARINDDVIPGRPCFVDPRESTDDQRTKVMIERSTCYGRYGHVRSRSSLATLDRRGLSVFLSRVIKLLAFFFFSLHLRLRRRELKSRRDRSELPRVVALSIYIYI